MATQTAIAVDQALSSGIDEKIVDAFAELERQLNGEIVERPDEIHGLAVAFVAAVHMFLLGMPGIAKSMLIDRALPRIDRMKLYKVLLAATTPPEEVVGPLDVSGLEDGHYRFLIDGYLPWADAAFADEIWKCNSALLNLLLGMTNEGTFKNDGQVIKVPLKTLLCASNELPGNESLAAIYDRIPLRYEVEDIKEDGNFQTMLETDLPDVESIEALLSWDDVLRAQEQAASLPISPQVYTTLVELRRELKDKGITATPRRWKQALRILRAEAWLDGSTSVEVEHLGILQHALWDRPEQQAELATVVLSKANPLEKESMALAREIEKIGREVDAAIHGNSADQHRLGLEIHGTIDKANNDLQELLTKAGSSRRQQAVIDQLRERLKVLTVRMITDVFHLDADTVDL